MYQLKSFIDNYIMDIDINEIDYIFIFCKSIIFLSKSVGDIALLSRIKYFV